MSNCSSTGCFQLKNLGYGFWSLTRTLYSRYFGLLLIFIVTATGNPTWAEAQGEPKIVKINSAAQIFAELENVSNEVSSEEKANLCKTFTHECSEQNRIFNMYSADAAYLIVQFEGDRVNDLVYVTPYTRLGSVSGWDYHMIIERRFPDEFVMRVDPPTKTIMDLDVEITRKVTFIRPTHTNPDSGATWNVVLEMREVFPSRDTGQMVDPNTGLMIGWKKVARYTNIDFIAFAGGEH